MIKQIQSILAALVIFTAVAIPTTWVVGCKTPTQQRVTYNTLFSLGKTVDVTYRSYLDGVVSGKFATNSVRSVSQHYDSFQALFRIATANVALGDTNAPSASLIAKAAEFTEVIENAKGEPK